MPFELLVTAGAERDIEEIVRYVTDHDGPIHADRILAALEMACSRPRSFSERGNLPKELRAVGIKEFREVHFKPYRIIYRVDGKTIIIVCVADGRRDMQSLLQRRVLR